MLSNSEPGTDGENKVSSEVSGPVPELEQDGSCGYDGIDPCSDDAGGGSPKGSADASPLPGAEDESRIRTDGRGTDREFVISRLFGVGTGNNVSPWVSASFSLFIYPGAGQLMNRSPGKALVYGAVFTLLAGFAVYYIVNGAMAWLVPELCSPSQLVPSAGMESSVLDGPFRGAFCWGAAAFTVYIGSALDAAIESVRIKNQRVMQK